VLYSRQEATQESLENTIEVLQEVKSLVDRNEGYFQSFREDLDEMKESQKEILLVLLNQETEFTKLSTQFKVVWGIVGAIGTSLLGLAAKFLLQQ